MAASEKYAGWLQANQDKRGTPDYETVLRAFQLTRMEELNAQKPAAPVAQPQSGLVPAFQAGLQGLRGAGAALAGRAGLMEMEAAKKAVAEREQRAREIFKPTEEWGLTKLLELVGGSAPYMLAPVAAAGAAATLPVTGTAAAALGLGAAGLASAAQFTGTNLQRQLETGKQLEETDLVKAALASLPMAALDTLSLRLLPGVGRLLGDAGIKVTKETAKEVSEQILKKAALDYTKATGRAMGAEGLTETAQQVFERLQAGLSIRDPEARKEYVESFIGGALLGGTLAPAGRYMERSRAEREIGKLDEAAAAQQRAAEEERKKSPEYLQQTAQEYQNLQAQREALTAQIKRGTEEAPLSQSDKDANDVLIRQVKALDRPLAEARAAFLQAGGPDALKTLQERQRVEKMSPLEYQMEQLGVDLSEKQPEQRVFTGEEPVAPRDETPPAVRYAAQQMSLAKQQDMGTFTEADYVQYLLQDPEMARALVASGAPIPGLDKKQSDAVLGGLKLQFKEQEKQTRAATQAALAQQQTDLAAQQRTVKTDAADLWKAAIEDTEEQATEELLRPNFETLGPSGPPVVKTPENITPIQNPQQLLARIDELVTARDQAARAAETAFASGNKEAGAQKSQEREAAQSALNQVEQTEGPGRALLALRKAQDAALMDTAALIDDLRAGRTLGGRPMPSREAFATDEEYAAAVQEERDRRGTASSTPQTLINQINRQRDAFITAAIQEAATTRRLFGKALTQEEATQAGDQMREVFNEWVTRSMAQPRKAVEEERVVQPAQMRGAELVRGAETARIDPRPLAERQFGAYKAATQVLQEQLRQIAARLSSVPKEGRRVEPTLKMQFPSTEAAKVAEAKGETAKTLEGSLRRRREYVGDLIDQAFQTRRVPGIASTLLTRAKDFLDRGTGGMLDAAENIADRLIRGQNIERSDLVTLRNEIRAASARPGEAEVAGEREGQAELFPKETRRAELGTIRETRKNFENAPPVKQGRALLKRGQELLTNIKTAWAEADKRAARIKEGKIAKAKRAVEQQRGDYRAAFTNALNKARLEQVVAKFQPQIDAAIQQLAAFGKERAKALAAKDPQAAKDIQTIMDMEREALQNLRQEFASAMQAPGTVLESAEMKGTKQTRGFTQPAEAAAAADAWVGFERDLLRKAEAKLARLQGPAKAPAAREVAAQRKAVAQAESVTQRAASGLGLPGVRRVAGRVTTLAPETTAAERKREDAERRAAEAEEVRARVETRNVRQQELEAQILALGDQRAEREQALLRAKTDASVERIKGEIEQIEKQATFAQGQLEALGEQKTRRKGPATVATAAALGKRTPLRTGYKKALESASEALRKERESDVELPGVFDFGPQEKLFPSEKRTEYDARDLTDLKPETLDAVEDGDIRTTLETLRKNGSTDFVRTVASRLQGLLVRAKLSVSDSVEHEGKQVEGLYNPANNSVKLNRSALSEEVVLHELTHAATMRALEADPQTLTPEQRAARKELENLYNSMQKNPAFEREYGRKNLKEFVSELMSNQAFRDKLDTKTPGLLKRLYNAFLRLIGMPPLTVSKQASDNAYKLFMPSKPLKAAAAPSVFRAKTDDFPAGLQEAGALSRQIVGREPGAVDKIRASLLGARQMLIDKLSPVEEAVANSKMESLKAMQLMYYLRMYDQRMNTLSQAISTGAPAIVEKTRPDGRVERLLEAQEGANIKGIVNILSRKDVVKAANGADNANALFTTYLAALRAERVGVDKLDLGKNVTQKDLDTARAQVDNDPVLSKAFREARDLYNQYNRNLLDFVVQTGALSREDANALLADNDYIPYYRIRNGQVDMLVGGQYPIRVGNLKDSPHLRELVGGEAKIMDFMTSSVQNTAMLLDMGMRNLAMRNMAFEFADSGIAKIGKLKKGAQLPEKAFEFKRDGEDYFAVIDEEKAGVDAEMLVRGLEGIPTMFPTMMQVMGGFSRVLRRAVVASPVYIARQMFRDTLAATMTSGANLVPVVSALKQIGKGAELERRGITGGQVFTGLPEDMTRLLKEMQSGRPGWMKAFSKLEAFSAQADALTRKAQYDSYIEQGRSELEATYMSLESMNFTRRGLSPSLHMLSMMIPFFNAQIQGLDVLYRAFRGKMPLNDKLDIRNKLLTRGALLAGLSLLYAANMEDDETYANARPEEKYNNWFVRMPALDEMAGEKVTLRVPIPFELGYIFKALPEALYNTMATEKGGEDAVKAFKSIATMMVPGLSSYFLPQAIKPAIETAMGTSILSGRSIESAYEQMVEPGQRVREGTSDVARIMGETLNISPVKLEYLIRGYTGSLGMALVQSLNFALPDAGPEAAYKRLSAMPVVGTLFQPEDSGGIIDAVYARMREVNQAKETYERLLESGQVEKATEFFNGRVQELTQVSMYGNLRQQLGELTAFERQVRASSMTPADKRETLDNIRRIKIEIAKAVRSAS